MRFDRFAQCFVRQIFRVTSPDVSRDQYLGLFKDKELYWHTAYAQAYHEQFNSSVHHQ